MKSVSSVAQVPQSVSADLMLDPTGAAGGAFEASRVIPVGQALAAIGDAVGTAELAQRLAATLAMLWSDVAAADLFLPEGAAGELKGVRDAEGGRALLQAVASPYPDSASVRVIPITATLVPGAARAGACMSAPVVSGGPRGQIEGFIIVQRRVGAFDFTARDLDALARLARGVGDLLPGVRARGGRSAVGWRERDLAQARALQRQFLPRLHDGATAKGAPANSAGARVLAEYAPAYEVGGDFYDVIDLGGGRLMAAIGDVSGKGVAAALLMSRVSSQLRRLAAEATGPADMLTRLNRAVAARADARPDAQDDASGDYRFVTVVCVLLDVPNRRWVVCNAGHVVPILRRASGAVTGLAYASGPPIGMVEDPQFVDEEFPLEARDILVLATDGVFDSMAGERRPCSTMGNCKLTELVQKGPHDLAEIHRRILEAASARVSGRDDIALLGLELGAG